MAEKKEKSGLIWTSAGVLAAGALVLGTQWAFPAFHENQNLAKGTQASFAVPSTLASSSSSTVASSAVPTGATPSTSASSASATSPIDVDALAAKLTSLSKDYTSGNVTMLVTDQATGQVLFSKGATEARMPASNFKLLTDYTLMRVQNPQDRYETKIVRDGQNLTLVAGGDTLLGTGVSKNNMVVGHAGLQTLTQDTIAELVKEGVKGQVTLNLDTSIFAAPALNPVWDQGDIDAGFVTGVRPIAFFSHYSPAADGSASTSRPQDAASQVFQAALDQLNAAGKAQGLTFKLGTEQKAPASAQQVASIYSATVAEQAAYMMQESDNMLAETLARNAAVAAGQPTTLEGVKNTLTSTLSKDGINLDKLKISDFCGLSPENTVTNQTLIEITDRIVKGENGAAAALPGFPVAGGTGTLATRFNDDKETAAQGYAHAKTGTLNKVSSLTGYTTNAEGRVILYSIITNDIEDLAAAKNLIDSSVSAITQS